MTAPLQVSGLSASYGPNRVLENVSFSVVPSSLTAIIGPNGAGKSTLIKSVMGLIQPDGGEISIFGKPVTNRLRKSVAYMPQRNSVDWDFPASAVDVVTMGLYAHIGWLKPVRKSHKETALHCLSQVGLEAFADRPIGQLSGGQQQRVFLARALAQNADLYLMDEPFAGVDAVTENSIIAVLRNLQASGKTVICVHHDLQTVADYFDHVIALNVRKMAEGPVSDVMKDEVLQKTYGGRLLVIK